YDWLSEIQSFYTSSIKNMAIHGFRRLASSLKKHKQKIYVTNVFKLSPFSRTRVKYLLQTLMQATPYPKFDVGIVFVSNEEIQERNREDRGVDTPTDILSYPFNDIEKPGIIPREELRY